MQRYGVRGAHGRDVECSARPRDLTSARTTTRPTRTGGHTCAVSTAPSPQRTADAAKHITGRSRVGPVSASDEHGADDEPTGTLLPLGSAGEYRNGARHGVTGVWATSPHPVWMWTTCARSPSVARTQITTSKFCATTATRSRPRRSSGLARGEPRGDPASGGCSESCHQPSGDALNRQVQPTAAEFELRPAAAGARLRSHAQRPTHPATRCGSWLITHGLWITPVPLWR